MTSNGSTGPTSSDAPDLPYARPCLENDDLDAVARVFDSGFLSTGPEVARFEQALADRLSVRFAAVVSSGTAALHAAYFAVGICEGDEVVVPAITFVATANMVLHAGGTVSFADVCPDTGLLTAATLEPRITSKTRAVVPVHLTGTAADLEPIALSAKRVGAIVIEDAAHALGATYQCSPVGSCRFSQIAILSFHPTKSITTAEGGAVLTNDRDIFEKIRSFRNHGFVHDPARFELPNAGPWYHELHHLGHNLRLTDLQCALGVSQLKKLDRFLSRRRQIADRYDRLLQEMQFIQPVTRSAQHQNSAMHLYVVLIDFEAIGRSRAQVMSTLKQYGIGTQVHYIPVPSQPYYRRLGWDPGQFPGALRYYARALSLPMYPTMQDSDVDRVVTALQVACRE